MAKGIERSIEIFTAHHGILRTSQALALGIAPRTLYAMRDAGLIRQISRGIYQLATQEPPYSPDWITIALRIPKAVICLLSALQYYGLTTQIPHKVYVALPRTAEKPRLEFPPLNITWLSNKSYLAGIVEQSIENVQVKIYSQEKTIADCFKFRKKVGMEVALEALKDYVKQPDHQLDQLIAYARIDRVEKIISQYLEILL